jgi:hypothetical protein
MTNPEEYSRLIQKIFEEFRISDYNKKIAGLNAVFDKPENLNIVSIAIGNSAGDKKKELRKGPKNTTFKVHGAVKETVKNFVNDLQIEKFNILEILPELKKIDPNIKQQSVAGVLKKWALQSKGKHVDLGVDGIEIFRRGKGTKPTIFKKRPAI